jgi:DNA segregation ATPase FtsK/SpoIIIE-like protein
MPQKSRDRVIDHELYHCAYDIAASKFYLRRHDLEEFILMVDRYGFADYNTEAAMRVAMHQLPLAGVEPERRGKIEAIAAKIEALPPEERDGMKEVVAMLADGTQDPLLNEAVEFFRQSGEISISKLQRHLRIAYTRAAHLVNEMKAKNLIVVEDHAARVEVKRFAGAQ